MLPILPEEQFQVTRLPQLRFKRRRKTVHFSQRIFSDHSTFQLLCSKQGKTLPTFLKKFLRSLNFPVFVPAPTPSAQILIPLVENIGAVLLLLLLTTTTTTTTTTAATTTTTTTTATESSFVVFNCLL